MVGLCYHIWFMQCWANSLSHVHSLPYSFGSESAFPLAGVEAFCSLFFFMAPTSTGRAGRQRQSGYPLSALVLSLMPSALDLYGQHVLVLATPSMSVISAPRRWRQEQGFKASLQYMRHCQNKRTEGGSFQFMEI